jgi:hypothetical protein
MYLQEIEWGGFDRIYLLHIADKYRELVSMVMDIRL